MGGHRYRRGRRGDGRLGRLHPRAPGRGCARGGEGLAPSATATAIRLNEEHIVNDGPYAETKEQLGGFYLIDVADVAVQIEFLRRRLQELGG